MQICYVGIGSNLGNRRDNIDKALKKIKALKDTRIIKVSKFIESDPVGGPRGQNKFLNGALKIQTNLPPVILLKKFKKIESELGRSKSARNAPRVIDLDILLYGERIMNTRILTIPHPRMFQRDFVLKPLAEII